MSFWSKGRAVASSRNQLRRGELLAAWQPGRRTRKILDDLYEPRVLEGAADGEARLAGEALHGVVGSQDVANKIAGAEQPRAAFHMRKQQRAEALALPRVCDRQGDFAALTLRRNRLDRLGDHGRLRAHAAEDNQRQFAGAAHVSEAFEFLRRQFTDRTEESVAAR